MRSRSLLSAPESGSFINAKPDAPTSTELTGSRKKHLMSWMRLPKGQILRDLLQRVLRVVRVFRVLGFPKTIQHKPPAPAPARQTAKCRTPNPSLQTKPTFLRHLERASSDFQGSAMLHPGPSLELHRLAALRCRDLRRL